MTNVEPVIHDVDFSMTCCKLYVFLCKMIDMCHFLLGRWERREGGRGEEGGEGGGREGGRNQFSFQILILWTTILTGILQTRWAPSCHHLINSLVPVTPVFVGIPLKEVSKRDFRGGEKGERKKRGKKKGERGYYTSSAPRIHTP